MRLKCHLLTKNPTPAAQLLNNHIKRSDQMQSQLETLFPNLIYSLSSICERTTRKNDFSFATPSSTLLLYTAAYTSRTLEPTLAFSEESSLHVQYDDLTPLGALEISTTFS